MSHLAAVPHFFDGTGTALLLIDRVFRQSSLIAILDWLESLEFHRRGAWHTIIHVHIRSSADRWSNWAVNHVIGDVLLSVCAESTKTWSMMLPVFEFALNNAVHTSNCFAPFNMYSLTYPRVPLTIPLRVSGLAGNRLLTTLLVPALTLCRNKWASFSRRALVS